MPTVRLHYFASLREAAGKSEEERTTQAATLGDLYDELRREYGFTLGPDSVRVAVGNDYVPPETEVVEGLEITFIPPVAGG